MEKNGDENTADSLCGVRKTNDIPVQGATGLRKVVEIAIIIKSDMGSQRLGAPAPHLLFM